MMDLDDGVESTPGLTDTHPGRGSMVAPFLGAQQMFDKQMQQQQQQQQQQFQLQQQQNGYKQSAQNVAGGNSLNLRHNNALAVSIETDV
mgnify:CR=1 FL=1